MGKLEEVRLISEDIPVGYAEKNLFSIPLVSIGVPNYNYAQFVLSALESIERQTYSNIEIIVVDDCSTDNSVDVIENWLRSYTGVRKIRLIKNSNNAGLTKVCNQILACASGTYIQFLDADDTIMPDKIVKQVTRLESAADAALIYSDVFLMHAGLFGQKKSYLTNIGYDRNNMPSGRIHEQLFDFNFVPLPSALVRTALIKEVGGFDETLAVQDYYLWLKLSERYSIIYMRDFTATYRIHQQSMSNNFMTSPKSLDSVLQICFRYHKKSNKTVKKKIRRLLHYASPILYKAAYPTALYWLKQDLWLNPNIKTLFLLVGCYLNVPYSFFSNLRFQFNRL